MDPGNCRPVPLTSVPCKILKSLIKDELMEHQIGNKLIKYTQHGFMPGKSCAANLTMFMDTVTKATDEGKAVNMWYFPISPPWRILRWQQLTSLH